MLSVPQEVLRQHLQQHAFSTATAQDTLTRILQLAPGDMSGNALQVITGWRAPGSPLIQLSTTPQVGRRHGFRHAADAGCVGSAAVPANGVTEQLFVGDGMC